MSNLIGDKEALGRPDAQVEAGYYYFPYCGGLGGGGCLTPLGLTSTAVWFRVPRFVVRNRRLILQNKEFAGIRIYSNGGASGGCPNSLGVEKTWYMAISSNGNLTEAEIVARGVPLSGALPYFIEFTEDKLPQPIQGSWGGYLVAQIYWGDAGYVNEGDNPISNNSLRIVKHDYDTVI